MIQRHLSEMVRGWLVGNFEPSIWKTDQCEVSIKEYKRGDRDERHYHKESIEYTVILNGSVVMNDNIYKHGDVIIINKYESTDFIALTDVTTVVIRDKSIPNDKHMGYYNVEKLDN